MATKRVDEFLGSDQAYILYLEKEVRALRSRIDKSDELPSTARIPRRGMHPKVQAFVGGRSSSTTPIQSHQAPQSPCQDVAETRATRGKLTQAQQQLEFVLELPGPPSLCQPKWMALLKGFTNCIPASEAHWQGRRHLVQIDIKEGMVNSINDLTLSSPRNPAYSTSNTTAAREMRNSDIIRNYREGMAKMKGEQMRARQISRFAALLYTCSCIVAIANSADKKKVDSDMAHFFGSKAGQDYFRQVRKGALWAINQINELQRKGLRHRAWELFFLCGTEMSAYEKCTHHKDSSRYNDIIKIPKTPDGEKTDLSFNIPILVWKIGGGIWSLSLINQALDTNVSEEEQNAWIQAFSAAQWSSGERSSQSTSQRVKRPRLDQTPNTINDNQQECPDGPGMRALLNAVGLQPQNDLVLGGIHPLALNTEPSRLHPISNGTQDAIWSSIFDHPDYALGDPDPLIHDFSFAETEFTLPGCSTFFLDIMKSVRELIDQAHAIKFADITKDPLPLDYALVNGTRVEAANHHHQELTSVLKAWELKWPSELDGPTEQVVSDLDSQIQQQIRTKKYDWETQLVMLEVGGLRPRDVALCSVIIPVQMLEADSNRWVQFDRDKQNSLVAVKEWPVLSILPRDICIRRVKCSFIFIRVQVYPKGTLDLDT
ncbi:hypothetical protein PG999_004533 [Apiospora kogelbergensis]|uniref:PH domain-containing protein n=1 Tax=Apiospora kogelbergensis TaxID=1337665 RepID=A0AAW0QZM0_9PEZI